MADSPSASDGGPGARPAAVLTAVGLAVVLAVTAAVLVLIDRSIAAGIVMAVAGSSLVLAGAWVAGTQAGRLSFVDAVAERAVDVSILGAIAWASLPDDGFVSAAALTALVTSYLSSYLRAKATGLRFPLDPAVIERPLRLGLIALALFGVGGAVIPLWLATAVSLQSVVRLVAAIARAEAR